MDNILEMYRKTLKVESELFGTPDSCTIKRAMELIASAYEIGYQESSKQELREKYAGMFLQGIISTSEMSILKHKEEAVKEAIEFADILIEKIRKQNKEYGKDTV